MGRKNKHSREEIRELALQAATQIVAEQGFQGLSTRKVAAAMGYAVGSLYMIFQNFDELILQVNARTLDELYTVISQTQRQHLEPEECLLALGQTYFQFTLAHQPSWRMIFEHRLPHGSKLPSWYRRKILRFFNLLAKPLQQIQPHRTCDQDARALWGSVHGICILADKLEVVGVDSVQYLLELLIKTYVTGLKGEVLTD